jgi:hypothetical protein
MHFLEIVTLKTRNSAEVSIILLNAFEYFFVLYLDVGQNSTLGVLSGLLDVLLDHSSCRFTLNIRCASYSSRR